MDHGELVKMFGAFNGLAQGVATGSLTQQQAESLLEGYLGAFILRAAGEAEGELRKLTDVVGRIKSLAQSVSSSDSLKFQDPRVAQMMSASKALDGWTASLLETNYTILAILEGMPLTTARSAALVSGMQSTINARFLSGSFFKDGTRALVF